MHSSFQILIYLSKRFVTRVTAFDSVYHYKFEMSFNFAFLEKGKPVIVSKRKRGHTEKIKLAKYSIDFSISQMLIWFEYLNFDSINN